MSEPLTSNGNGNFAQRYSTIVQTVTVAALFVGGFWAGVINPLSTRLDKIEDSNKHALEIMDHGKLSVPEYREFHERIDASLLRVQEDLSKLRDSQVTRGEHTQKWASDAATFANLQRQIDEMKKEFGSSFSLGDKIKELQAELNDIRHQGSKP